MSFQSEVCLLNLCEPASVRSVVFPIRSEDLYKTSELVSIRLEAKISDKKQR